MRLDSAPFTTVEQKASAHVLELLMLLADASSPVTVMDAWEKMARAESLKVSVNHVPAYLQEMTWGFNNRRNPSLFRDTMMKLIRSDNLEYKELTKAA
jgi:hypothetical protein